MHDYSELEPTLLSDDPGVALRALREVLVGRLGEAKPGESAALARQLADVMARIAGLPGEEKSDLDDLADRRAARRAAVPERADRTDVRGKRGG